MGLVFFESIILASKLHESIAQALKEGNLNHLSPGLMEVYKKHLLPVCQTPVAIEALMQDLAGAIFKKQLDEHQFAVRMHKVGPLRSAIKFTFIVPVFYPLRIWKN